MKKDDDFLNMQKGSDVSPSMGDPSSMQTSGSEMADAILDNKPLEPLVEAGKGLLPKPPIPSIGGESGKGLPSIPSSMDDAKEMAKDAAKDIAKDALKEGAKKVAPTVGKAAVAGAKPAAIGAGAGVGAIEIYAAAHKGAMAIAGSKGVTMAAQTLGAGAKLVSGATSAVSSAWGAATGAVNGAVNGILGAFSAGSVTVAGSAPTLAVGGVMSASVTTALVSTGAFVNEDDMGLCGDASAMELSSVEVNLDGASTASWQVPGSEGWIVAETIFKRLVEYHGFSGAAAAGAVANAIRESTLNPQADNPSGGVHGVFQWSGWSHNLNGDRWAKAPLGKVDTLENQIMLMDLELNTTHNKTKRVVGHMLDHHQAALEWAYLYEGLSRTDARQVKPEKTMAWADWAYAEFDGHLYEPNERLLGQKTTEEMGDIASAQKDEQDCETSSLSLAMDGTGVNPIIKGQGQYFGDPLGTSNKPMPEELKQYMKDPRAAGLSWGSPKGHWNPGGQCVHFASSYFHAIWEGSPSGVRYASGYMGASAWSKKMKGELTKENPRAGAIIGIPRGAHGIHSAAHGHVAVVQHVFENGDFLMAETNVPGLSGDSNGRKNTWSFKVVFRDDYMAAGYEFFNPDPNVYTLKWDGWNRPTL